MIASSVGSDFSEDFKLPASEGDPAPTGEHPVEQA
jgi:hypothetical protein